MRRCGPAILSGLLALGWLHAQQPSPQDMPQEMVWVDRSGRILGRVGAVQNSIFFPEISPDGRFIAVSARDGEVNDRDIWVHDVANGTKKPVAPAKGNDNFPVWSPDGRRIAFTSSRTGNYDLYLKSLDPDAPEKPIVATEQLEFCRHWSPDGKLLCYTRAGAAGRELMLLRMDGPGRTPEVFLARPNAWVDGARFSPNSKYRLMPRMPPGRAKSMSPRLTIRRRAGKSPESFRWAGPGAGDSLAGGRTESNCST